MSLYIYTRREDVPAGIKVIDNNDVFFSGFTTILNTSLAHKILSDVDGATRLSDMLFKGRFFPDAGLSKDMLSTGTKTLLNVLMHKDICFNCIECGSNALSLLAYFTDGHILCEAFCMPDLEADIPCDIVVYNTHFTSFIEALNAMYHKGVD